LETWTPFVVEMLNFSKDVVVFKEQKFMRENRKYF
jgi:hypothetical protein